MTSQQGVLGIALAALGLIVIAYTVAGQFRDPPDVRAVKQMLGEAAQKVKVDPLAAAAEFNIEKGPWQRGPRQIWYPVLVRLSTGGQLTGQNRKPGEEPDIRLLKENNHGQRIGEMFYEAALKATEGNINETTYYAPLPYDRTGPEFPKRMFLTLVVTQGQKFVVGIGHYDLSPK